jgi:hypothetical protein
MMNTHRNIQGLLYEYHRGELSSDQQLRVQEHLDACKRCSAASEEIQLLVTSIPVPSRKASDERPEQYWSAFSTNVVNRIRRREQRDEVQKVTLSEYLRSVFTHQRWTLVTAGVGLVVVSAIVLTWQLRPSREEGVGQFSAIGSENRTPTVQARYNQYLRKSQILMVGLMNMKQESGGQLDLSAERDLSRQLVQEARYLHDQDIDEHAKQLIRELEKILIELSNLEEQHDLPGVEILRAGIRQENLLFKIRMGEQFSLPQPPSDRTQHQSKKGQSL